jgi:hypothetical protein
MNMETSVFLARFLGLFFFIFGITLLLQRKRFQQLIQDILDRPTSQLLAALFPVLLGSLVITLNNVWTGWPTLITIIGWMMLVVGTLRGWFYQVWLKSIEKGRQRINPTVGGILLTFLGVILLYCGYFL